MRLFLRANVLGGTGLFAVALALLPAAVEAQINTPALAVTYNAERAKTSLSSCGCFWLKGGTMEGSVMLFKGLGAVANFSGEQGNVASGVGISHISYLAGPRYTLRAPLLGKNHATLLFGDALFGGIHAFDSAFPAAAGTNSSANAFAMQLGGGLDLNLGKGFGIRALELDYVRSTLPNNASNTQDNLRLAFGITYRFVREK